MIYNECIKEFVNDKPKTPESIKGHSAGYQNHSWQDYTLQELGNWVHLLAKRSQHRSNEDKKRKDLEDAQNLLKEKRGPRKNWDYRSERMKNFGSIPKDLRSCYLKEARAMLEGKDTYGKNKCVELPEESSQTMKIVIAREESCVAVN